MNNKNLELEAFMSAAEMYPVMKAVYESVKDLDPMQFFCALAEVIGAWAESNKVSKEDTVKLLELLTKSQKEDYESEE